MSEPVVLPFERLERRREHAEDDRADEEAGEPDRVDAAEDADQDHARVERGALVDDDRSGVVVHHAHHRDSVDGEEHTRGDVADQHEVHCRRTPDEEGADQRQQREHRHHERPEDDVRDPRDVEAGAGDGRLDQRDGDVADDDVPDGSVDPLEQPIGITVRDHATNRAPSFRR